MLSHQLQLNWSSFWEVQDLEKEHNALFWLKNMDLSTYLQAIYLEIKLNQAHLWVNKSNRKSAKVSSFLQTLWLSLFNKKYKETIMAEDICLTVSQEVNKTWTYGKKLWPNGLILKPSSISTAKKTNLLKDFYTEVKQAEGPMIMKIQSRKDSMFSMTIQNQSLIIILNSVRFAESMLTDQFKKSQNKSKIIWMILESTQELLTNPSQKLS